MNQRTGSEVRIGVVGVGTMGRPLVSALVAAGRDVVVHDRYADLSGLNSSDTLRQLAAACDVVVLSLPGPAEVREVVPSFVNAATVLLDTSTVGPDTSRWAAEQLDGRYSDTPILGRPAGVGTWTIPVGGEWGSLAEQVFAPVAKRVVGVGPVGAAATLKVLNNLMLGVINASTAEVLTLAERSGLEPGVFVETLLDSGAASISGLFRDVAPRAVTADFAPTFAVALMHKDNALALELADAAGLDLPVARAAQRLNADALAAGLAAEDSIAVIKRVT